MSTEPKRLNPITTYTTSQRAASLREQLEALTLQEVDEALAAARVAADMLTQIVNGSAPQGLRARASLLATHIRHEADGIQALRDRL